MSHIYEKKCIPKCPNRYFIFGFGGKLSLRIYSCLANWSRTRKNTFTLWFCYCEYGRVLVFAFLPPPLWGLGLSAGPGAWGARNECATAATVVPGAIRWALGRSGDGGGGVTHRVKFWVDVEQRGRLRVPSMSVRGHRGVTWGCLSCVRVGNTVLIRVSLGSRPW